MAASNSPSSSSKPSNLSSLPQDNFIVLGSQPRNVSLPTRSKPESSFASISEMTEELRIAQEIETSLQDINRPRSLAPPQASAQGSRRIKISSSSSSSSSSSLEPALSQPDTSSLRPPVVPDHSPTANESGVQLRDPQSRNSALKARKKDNHPSSQVQVPDASKPSTIDNHLTSMMKTLSLRVSNEFSPIQDPQADTLVYISPPPRLPHHSISEDTQIKQHFHRFHLIDSSRFKALGSKKFGTDAGQLLGAGCSIRAQKRLKKLDIYQRLPQSVLSQIKFHVDLSPPSEDDEAVLLLTSLTCTNGVRNWYKAKEKYHIPQDLISGTDELDTMSNPYNLTQIPTPESVPEDQNEAAPVDVVTQAASPDLSVTELCPLRQHSAVERMLNAICGRDPKLDSAPKAWALFATANYYDCAKHPDIGKWIHKWVYSGPNANFIQNNPEVVYQIGLGCENTSMVKDAFSILVGEKALLDVQSEHTHSMSSTRNTAHGRQLENLDDDERNRIDHAASSFIARVRALRQSIVVDLDWLTNSAEFKRLCTIDLKSPGSMKKRDAAITAVRQYCSARLEAMMCVKLCMPFSDHDASASQTMQFRSGSMVGFEKLYNDLPKEARAYTRSLWMAFSRVAFSEGEYSHSIDNVIEVQAGDLPEQPTVRLDKWSVTETLVKLNDSMYRDAVAEYNHAHDFLAAMGSGSEQQTKASKDLKEEESSDNVRRQVTSSHVSGSGEAASKPTLDLSSPTKRPSQDTTSVLPSSLRKRRRTFEREEMVNPTSIDSTSNPAHKSEASATRSGKPAEASGDAVTKSTYSAHVTSSNRLGTASAPFAKFADSQSRAIPGRSAPSNDDVSSGYAEDFDGSLGFSVYGLNGNSAPTNETTGHEGYQPIPTNKEPRASDSASMHVLTGKDADALDDDHGLLMPPSSPKQRGRIMQQFSDTEPVPGDDAHESTEFRWEHLTWNVVNRQRRETHINYFATNNLLPTLSQALAQKCNEIVYPPHLFHSEQAPPIDLVDTMVCLDDNEWKYLPLWAGGLDDGKGGVFDEVHVPNDDAAGFRGGKRGIKGVSLNGTYSVSGSESSGFDDIASEAMSSVGRASQDATDGTATVRSIDDSDTGSDVGFMDQSDMYAAVQEMKMAKLEGNNGKAPADTTWKAAEDYDFDKDDDEDDDGDVSTVMGAGSDVQADFFGDDNNEPDENMDNDDEDEDDDMEIIEKSEAMATGSFS